MRQYRLILALLFPILVPIGLVLYHTYTATGTVWHLPIRGFDPRDLLRGRYIEFRYDTNAFPKIDDGMVLCLNGELESPTFTSIDRTNIDECAAWIDPIEANLYGSHRFYMPESIADEADNLFRQRDNNFHALVTIRNGQLRLQSLSVNNIDIHISATQDEDRNEP